MYHDKILRRLGCGVLSLAVLLSGFPAYAAGADLPQNAIFIPAVQPESEGAEQYAADDRVNIIIELEDKPLLDDRKELSRFSAVSDYLESSAAQTAEKKLARARTSMQRALNTSGMDVSVEREYSVVFNGLSVEADYGDLKAIQAMDGVKRAFVAEKHALIQPVAYEPMLSGSVPSIGADIANDTGYTGKGAAVAILDTGLDLSHEAFQGAVNGPKYSKEAISDILNTKKLTVGKLSVDVLYQNSKVPYAYDYADADTNVSGGDSHGTHVAGIVGANSGDTVKGVAQDAQLLIMKVFGDNSGGAYDNDILAALDDSIKLGADAINMSLGTPAGFSYAETKSMREVYQRVVDAGVNLMCAAGNSYSSAYKNADGNDLPRAENPDSSTVSSPSTYAAAVSVASMNNVKATSPYFIAAGRHIRYNDAAEDTSKQLTVLEGTYDYVDCGVGATTDFSGSLNGKVALIQRGGEENGSVLTFSQKEQNARAKGAVAVIVYDNVEGDLVSMAADGKIPAVFISKADGEAMAAAEDKTVSISADYVESFTDSYSGKMSDFSSWGVTPDLKLKPEITAPGGNIYSTLPGSRYGSMSGTSMASPHMAGAAALMDQYIREEQDGLNLSQSQRAALADNLMMSTAVPVKDDAGNPYSPRKQGAGLVQLSRAVQAKAYLTGTDQGRPKAEMGASAEGRFSFNFDVHNLSASEIQYEVSVRVQTEAVTTENGKKYIAERARMLGSDMVSVTAPQTVTLGADGTANAAVSLALTNAGKSALDADFPNGTFIEGYVTLIPVNGGDTISLSLPFMGFYGDWSEAPLFDASLYDEEDAAVYPTQLGWFASDGYGYILGKNQYSSETLVNKNWIAIPGGDKTHHLTAAASLLRNADTLSFTVTDSAGETVYQEDLKQQSKTYYNDQSYHTPMAIKGFVPVDDWGSALPDGDYTYTVTGTVSGREQSVSFPLTIDSEKPQVLKSEIVMQNGKRTWKVTVKDNHYIQAACAAQGNSKLTDYIFPQEKQTGAETVLSFDLTKDPLKNLSSASIALVDYAGNMMVSSAYPLTGSPSEETLPESVELDKTQLSMQTGEQSVLTATVKPENATDKTVSWSSSDQSIAAVDTAGRVTAAAAGTATITATTVNGLTAQCSVTVRKAQEPSGTALASLYAPALVKLGERVPFDFQLEQMQRVATVSFTFEKDAALTDGQANGLNGFTVLDGIQWKSDNTGVLMLSYLKGGAGSSLTAQAVTDIARVTFASGTAGTSGLRMTGVTVSGYDADGKAVYLSSAIKNAAASVTIYQGVNCDVNRDGVVNQLDITFCQLYYRAASGDANWATASRCDLDGNGKVDVQDLVIILHAIYEG